MSALEDDWREPVGRRGVELSVEESVALWEFFQQISERYWEIPHIAAIAEKTKSFHKYGPWESE